jgi:ribosomal protein S18 acetylase RimI-like enzyme
MGGITIDIAKVEDALGTIEVQYKTWLETYPNEKVGITREDIEDRYKDALGGKKLEKRIKAIQEQSENERILVAKDSEKVVAFCYLTSDDKKNQLQAIYILPEYQGKGIGTKIWERAREFFNKEMDVYVEVADYNEKAISFYKKLGFVDTRRRWTDETFKMKSGAVMPEMEMKLDKSLL